jgi:hypothetical protein
MPEYSQNKRRDVLTGLVLSSVTYAKAKPGQAKRSQGRCVLTVGRQMRSEKSPRKLQPHLSEQVPAKSTPNATKKHTSQRGLGPRFHQFPSLNNVSTSCVVLTSPTPPHKR